VRWRGNRALTAASSAFVKRMVRVAGPALVAQLGIRSAATTTPAAIAGAMRSAVARLRDRGTDQGARMGRDIGPCAASSRHRPKDQEIHSSGRAT
jgi:hypothetical protein